MVTKIWLKLGLRNLKDTSKIMRNSSMWQRRDWACTWAIFKKRWKGDKVCCRSCGRGACCARSGFEACVSKFSNVKTFRFFFYISLSLLTGSFLMTLQYSTIWFSTSDRGQIKLDNYPETRCFPSSRCFFLTQQFFISRTVLPTTLEFRKMLHDTKRHFLEMCTFFQRLFFKWLP